MQKNKSLQFDCQSCKHSVCFSLDEIEQREVAECPNCQRKYIFKDETLRRQLNKFDALCRQIRDSEEILAHTAIGIDVAGHKVKVPYKLLLTRLTTSLELKIGEECLTINFRAEPLKGDAPFTIIDSQKVAN